MYERKIVVRLNEGLHARPAAQFVRLARSYAADLQVSRQGKSADAKSTVKLMLLGVKENDEIVLRGNGADESEAVEALCRYVADDKGTPAAKPTPRPTPAPTPSPTPAAASTNPSIFKGAPASAGPAVGPAFVFLPERIEAPRRAIEQVEVEPELLRLRAALAKVDAAIAARAASAAPDSQEADIIAALAEIGRDEELLRLMETHIRNGWDAVTAALAGGAELARQFEAMEDPYLRARSEDVAAYARQVALAQIGRRDPRLNEVPPGAVVLADEINVFDLAGAPIRAFGGLATLKGGPTSHVAIIARSYGVPAVLGVNLDEARLRAARTIALDGSTGEVVVDPDPPTEAEFRRRVEEAREKRRQLAAFAQIEPRTRDGRLVEVSANLGSLKEIEGALEAGAMGVGLFRTELLFMERKRPLSEDEQAKDYGKLASAFAPRPVIVRTLDIGGDKAMPGIAVPHEDNSFLGWRGVRLCLDRRDIFDPQIRALLRASVNGNLKVMIPMVADVEEIRAVKRIVAECRAQLAAAGIAHGEFELGAMVETPAAALAAENLAAEVDFFSIGTNDLTQYVMAADRLNPRVAQLYRPDHPAVLKAVAMVCAAARAAGIWVGVCGEAAANPAMIPKFVALGVTELSMSAASIPMAKKCVTEI